MVVDPFETITVVNDITDDITNRQSTVVPTAHAVGEILSPVSIEAGTALNPDACKRSGVYKVEATIGDGVVTGTLTVNAVSEKDLNTVSTGSVVYINQSLKANKRVDVTAGTTTTTDLEDTVYIRCGTITVDGIAGQRDTTALLNGVSWQRWCYINEDKIEEIEEEIQDEVDKLKDNIATRRYSPSYSRALVICKYDEVDNDGDEATIKLVTGANADTNDKYTNPTKVKYNTGMGGGYREAYRAAFLDAYSSATGSGTTRLNNAIKAAEKYSTVDDARRAMFTPIPETGSGVISDKTYLKQDIGVYRGSEHTPSYIQYAHVHDPTSNPNKEEELVADAETIAAHVRIRYAEKKIVGLLIQIGDVDYPRSKHVATTQYWLSLQLASQPTDLGNYGWVRVFERPIPIHPIFAGYPYYYSSDDPANSPSYLNFEEMSLDPRNRKTNSLFERWAPNGGLVASMMQNELSVNRWHAMIPVSLDDTIIIGCACGILSCALIYPKYNLIAGYRTE